MRVEYRHAWMQKHPSPSNQRGDFHWHPDGVPAALRATLTDLATRERGQKASLWIIDGSYLAWARTFATLSPADQRRYTGLAVTIAQPAGETVSSQEWSAALPAILASLPLVDVGPLVAAVPAASACQIEPGPPGEPPRPVGEPPRPIDRESLTALFHDRDQNLASALYGGGVAQSRDPHASRLPALVGQLLSWLPISERVRPRTGVFTERALASASRPDGDGTSNLLYYLTAAWFCPPAIDAHRPGYALTCWQLVGDLLAAGGARSLAELFGELTRMAQAWNATAELYRYLLDGGALSARDIEVCDASAPSPLCAPSVSDAGWLWNRLLHYWGRGFLPDHVMPRLAELLARRITVDHLFHLDAPGDVFLPARYLRRLRYEALLSRSHQAALLAALTRRVPSLAANPEVRSA